MKLTKAEKAALKAIQLNKRPSNMKAVETLIEKGLVRKRAAPAGEAWTSTAWHVVPWEVIGHA